MNTVITWLFSMVSTLWQMITGNWFLAVLVGLFVIGLIFDLILYFIVRSRRSSRRS